MLGQVFAKDLPSVTILATGGTIAGEGTSVTGESYVSGKLSPQEILSTVPGVGKIAKINCEQISNIGSQDMSDSIWFKLANRIDKLLATDAVDGIVITHGTDTMEETAYFLNLVVKSDKPVILTGSMRPSTALSADGPLNLYNAIAVAGSSSAKGKGVLIVMNDTIQGARDCTKTDTTNVGTFRSPNTGYLGLVNYGVVKFYNTSTRKHTTQSQFNNVVNLKKLPKVDIIYGCEGGATDLITDVANDSDVQGIVYAGVGDGNMNKADVKALALARVKNKLVIISSRTGTGIVIKNAELNDSQYGFITADNLNPQKARILLMLSLTQTKDLDQIQKIFDEY